MTMIHLIRQKHNEPNFTELISMKNKLEDFLREEPEPGNENWKAAVRNWGEDYEEPIRKISGYFSNTYVFVYGTLMKGQANHDTFLKDNICLGQGFINHYDMYDLGSYPGIVRGNGKVCGEIYSVSNSKLQSLDRFEGEGYLYLRKPVNVEMADGSNMCAVVYVYNRSISGCPKITGRYGQNNESDFVWYVCYGSNLLKERLEYYIRGGYCYYNDRSYAPCQDTMLPVESRPVKIPYDMYY